MPLIPPEMMPSSEDIRWYRWLLGAAIGILGAAFGGGMASQRFLDRVQARLIIIEKSQKEIRKEQNEITRRFEAAQKEHQLIIEKVLTKMSDYMPKKDFEHEQLVCQRHLNEKLQGIDDNVKMLVKHMLDDKLTHITGI